MISTGLIIWRFLTHSFTSGHPHKAYYYTYLRHGAGYYLKS